MMDLLDKLYKNSSRNMKDKRFRRRKIEKKMLEFEQPERAPVFCRVIPHSIESENEVEVARIYVTDVSRRRRKKYGSFWKRNVIKNARER